MKTTKTIWKRGIATAVLAAVVLTGCSLEDLEESSYSPAEVGNATDILSVVATDGGEGFLVMWTKKAGSYGEVIYTDDLSRTRGRGYPLTANSRGTYSMPCSMVSHDSDEAVFDCKPSNVSYHKRVTLQQGVSYKWLVNYGFEHSKGEVEAVMQYHANGLITVE